MDTHKIGRSESYGNREKLSYIKRYAGEFAWPTILLALGCIFAFFQVISLTLSGIIPLWFGFLCNLFVVYLLFTPLHEASHDNIQGKHKKLKWVNDGVGHAVSALMFAPFDVFRILHLSHHRYTNIPTKDPDYWVASSNYFSTFLRCITIFPHYFWFLLTKSEASPKQKSTGVTILVGYLVFASYLGVLGYGIEVMMLWVLPGILGVGINAFAFDWLPHKPHQETQLLGHTTNYPGTIKLLLTLGQSLHQVHHVNPRIPFYRYHQAFAKVSYHLNNRDYQRPKPSMARF